MAADRHPDASQPPFLALEVAPERASVVLVAVPFDATTSYRAGTAGGPAAILRASAQVDLEDYLLGPIADRGIMMEAIEPWIGELSASVRPDAQGLIAVEGVPPVDEAARERVDAACERVRGHVRDRVGAILDAGRTPGVVGGEHGVSLGAIEACAAFSGTLGVVQVDAHMDLREAYCGLALSHASVMRNALERCEGVRAIAQVGVRDFSAAERDYARAVNAAGHKRVRCLHAEEIASRCAGGVSFARQVRELVAPLPQSIYVSFDIDALEVHLCPNTGTPVPGGLSFTQAGELVRAIRDSGKTVVGFDLVEVAPDPDPARRSVDEIVGARLLYKLCSLGRQAPQAAAGEA